MNIVWPDVRVNGDVVQFDFSEEWCRKAADLEEGYNVTAGDPMSSSRVTHYPILNRQSIFEEYKKVSNHPRLQDKDDREFGLIRSNLRNLRMVWNESVTEKAPDNDLDAIAFLEKQTLFGYPIKVDQGITYFEISVRDLEIPPARFTFDVYKEAPDQTYLVDAITELYRRIEDLQQKLVDVAWNATPASGA